MRGKISFFKFDKKVINNSESCCAPESCCEPFYVSQLTSDK